MPSLEGRTVAITGQRRAEEMAEMVRRLGGEPYVASTVNLGFEEAEDEAERLAGVILGGVDWVVFYTGIGVRAIFKAAEKIGQRDSFQASLESARVLSRGWKSLRALRENNRPPDQEATPATTEGVIDALRQTDITGKRVFVQAPGAMPPDLEDAISASGAELIQGTPYRFLPPEDPEKVNRLIRDLIEHKIDAIAFTSPPAVDNLFLAADEIGRAEELARALNEDVFTASVGPVTSAAIRDHGVEPALESENQRMGGLLSDLAQALSSEEFPAGNNTNLKKENPQGS